MCLSPLQQPAYIWEPQFYSALRGMKLGKWVGKSVRPCPQSIHPGLMIPLSLLPTSPLLTLTFSRNNKILQWFSTLFKFSGSPLLLSSLAPAALAEPGPGSINAAPSHPSPPLPWPATAKQLLGLMSLAVDLPPVDAWSRMCSQAGPPCSAQVRCRPGLPEGTLSHKHMCVTC